MKNLRLENLVNPVGIDVRNPRFSWLISSEKRNCMQKSYRVLVATEEDFSEKSIVWDSKEKYSEQCFNVIYDGAKLLPRTRYYWQVNAVDTLGDVHESSIAFFETGFMEESAFKNTLWLTKVEYPNFLLPNNSQSDIEKYNST